MSIAAPAPVAVEVTCDAPGWDEAPSEGDSWEALATRAVRSAAARWCARDAAMAVVALPVGAEVSVLLADDAAVAGLNARWRGRDGPTNVLSFAANEGGGPPSALLGDIVVAHGVALREARGQDKTLADHVAHLIVHGTLHLLGEDHDRDARADEMEDLERAALADLDIADPYDGTEPVDTGDPR